MISRQTDILNRALGTRKLPTTGVAAQKGIPLVSLFAIPKPFVGHIGMIQRNAIRSWARLSPQVEIFLCGDSNDEQLAEIADESGARVFDFGPTNQDAPNLNQAFQLVHRAANGNIIGYVNSDIILGPDMLDAIELLDKSQLDSYLAIGKRTNLNVTAELDPADSSQFRRLAEQAKRRGQTCSIVCKDYFLFTRELFRNVPPFRVGRGNWDNWMVFRAKQLGVPVVDLGNQMTAIHQRHDYQHVAGGRIAAYVSGAEARLNEGLSGGRHLVRGSTATWYFKAGELKKTRFPALAFLRDLPRFLSLLRNLLFIRYILAFSSLLLVS